MGRRGWEVAAVEKVGRVVAFEGYFGDEISRTDHKLSWGVPNNLPVSGFYNSLRAPGYCGSH